MTQHAAIVELIERYFCALDARDASRLEGIFTEDVEVRYHTGTAGAFVQHGRQAALSYLVANLEKFDQRIHNRANTMIEVSGDVAKATTHAVATIVTGAQVATRGLRYEDELTLADGRWAIRRRIHTPLWQFDADLAPPLVPPLALQTARRG